MRKNIGALRIQPFYQLTHSAFLFLSLNSTWNIILKTFEFNPKLALSISYCWFMVTIQMQPVIPWVGPVQHKVHFHTLVCRVALDCKCPTCPCHTASQHLCLSIFTCVYPHSKCLWGPIQHRNEPCSCWVLLLVGVSCFSLGKSEKEKEKKLP